ncbi:hypothetical protein [Trichormus azollae]|uniref:hypothetical protein n=1 Tax=Trichormus azollae TaxID=1164 RepID=UPI00325E9F77
MPKFLRLMITIVVLGGLLLISQQVFAQTWIPVRAGIPFGISGIALINQQSDSANDAGNDGPFQSPIYVPGYLGFYSKKI